MLSTPIFLKACVMTGRKYVCGRDARITLEKLWSKTPQHFAFQTIRKDILVHDPSFTQYRTLPELFPSGSISYVLANPYYGCEATVLKIDKEHQGRIQLQVLEPIVSTTNTFEKKLNSKYAFVLFIIIIFFVKKQNQHSNIASSVQTIYRR